MQKNIIIIASLSVFLAYVVYQLNKTSKSDEVLSTEPVDIPLIQNKTTAAIVEPTNIEHVKTIERDKEQANEEDKLTQELRDWTATHKSTVFDLIDNNASRTFAAKFKSFISEKNNFFESPKVNQDAVTDEYWAYNMEMTLTELILQHELSYNFEILNISCKQLTCEVIGIDRGGLAWREINQSVKNNYQLTNLIVQPDARKISLVEDRNFYIYYQYKFKKNLNH